MGPQGILEVHYFDQLHLWHSCVLLCYWTLLCHWKGELPVSFNPSFSLSDVPITNYTHYLPLLLVLFNVLISHAFLECEDGQLMCSC
jgi:hypothetical protein